MRFATQSSKSLGLLEEDQWPFILVDRLFLVRINLPLFSTVVPAIILRLFLVSLGAGEEVTGGASGMDVDGIGEIGDQASEGQAAGVLYYI